MLKISNKASIKLSLIFSGAFMIALIVMYFLLPGIISNISEMIYPPREVSLTGKIYLASVGYLILLVATAANALLFALLLRVLGGKVFSEKSVLFIRLISWAALGEAVLFLALTPYTVGGVFIGGAAFMLGVVLRVVKNVISEATEIKNENDFTI